ncbi:F-box protein At5g07610-like [Rutidosis leptorrhynchoides]|uniref:F-box protein At5g07610-like n=1 Tax=Rutidosis leptorrhynchoides TaxID=125765 RepID=UPI003A9A274A
MPTDDDSAPVPQLLAAEKVGSIEGLVTEILLRLPVRSLILFQSVSKHWYSLIKDNPCFKNPNNKPPDHPSGLFVPTSLGYVFVPFDIHNPVKFPTLYHIGINPRPVMFKHSCNGLMLCGNYNKDLLKLLVGKIYVFNPTINQTIRIPVPGNEKTVLGMSLAFDPLKSPHYKVICVFDDFDFVSTTYKYQIDMYSSQTCTYKLSYNLTMTRRHKIMFETGVYWNNAIHWIDKFGFIVYFDLDRETTYEIKVPFALLDRDYNNYLCYIFDSRDQLLLVELYRPFITKFKIYQLKRDYSDWLVKYHVDFEEFDGLLSPESLNTDPFQYNYLLSIVLGSDDVETESFLVVEIYVSGDFCRKTSNHRPPPRVTFSFKRKRKVKVATVVVAGVTTDLKRRRSYWSYKQKKERHGGGGGRIWWSEVVVGDGG